MRSIASSDADVFPICESYATALDRINDFAIELLQLEYAMDLRVNERIQAVVVTSLSGEQRTLAPEEYSYDSESGILTLADGAIAATDRSLDAELELT